MRAQCLDDLAAALRFYTRLPLPAAWGGAALLDFSRAAWAAPAAGAIVGVCGAAVLLAARAFGVSPLPAAACAVAALVAVTGALHEDGLADLADGLGGATPERRLEIMRDSRLGSFGACALVLSLLLRTVALAAIWERGAGFGVAALIASGALSRAAGLLPMALLAPARADGAGAAAPRPDARGLAVALLAALAFSAPVFAAGAPPGRVFVAAAGAVVGAWATARLAGRRLGGYTGDVLGAAQQAAEMAALLLFSAA
jgi:adenosylcobinamide-GDP ribazoletransferase